MTAPDGPSVTSRQRETVDVPLDDREQKILDEIERQFYQEDPSLAQRVARSSLGAFSKKRQRLAIVGFIAGMVVMLVAFTANTWIALLGFMTMVISAGWLAMNLRQGSTENRTSNTIESWADRLRQRWGRSG